MQWPITLTVSILLAGQVVSAGLPRDISHALRRDATTERILRRRAASIVNADYVEKRSAVAGSTTANATAWESETEAACISALTNLATPNESGMAVCYNLPTLDSTTGTFQADMRLYRVADATGQFAGLSADGVQVQLSYNGAMVQPINSNQVAKREVHSLISWPSTKREDELDRRAATTPALTQTYAFSGAINSASMTANMTDAELQALVLPTVTLTAMSAQNVPVFNTTLNSTQAAFLVGAFSAKAATTGTTGSTTAAANNGGATTATSDNAGTSTAAADNGGTTTTAATNGGTTTAAANNAENTPAAAAAVAAADNSGTTTSTDGAKAITSSTTFILPGTKILIFPIGAIITGTWTLFGVGVVMYGTLGRIQFRDQYRRQSARQNGANIARI